MSAHQDLNADVHRLDAQLLSDLWVFRSAGRFGSITEAAKQLGVTQSAVSQRVLRLEARLNVPLFIRNKSRISLTDSGMRLMESMTIVANELNESISRIYKHRKGSIVVSCVPSLAMEWLVPRLDSFYREQPGIGIFLRSEMMVWTPERLDDEGVDLAIDYTGETGEGLHELAAVREILFPVCSRAYRNNREAGCGAAAVLLHDDVPGAGGGANREWDDWRRATQATWPDAPMTDRHFNLSILALHAAACHQGIAMGRAAIVERLVQRGDLVPASSYAPIHGPNYRVVTHRPGDAKSPVRVFAAWWARAMTETQSHMLSLVSAS